VLLLAGGDQKGVMDSLLESLKKGNVPGDGSADGAEGSVRKRDRKNQKRRVSIGRGIQLQAAELLNTLEKV
jgi:hypothetical protein